MITQLQIDNFKSLKEIDVKFGRMNFLVGPNASGKSNFAEALDFISHAIRENLPYAVAEKGGFYNICHRRQRRARGAIAFEVRGSSSTKTESFVFKLAFQLKTQGEDIRADYFVESEELEIEVRKNDSVEPGPRYRIIRTGTKYEITLHGDNTAGKELSKRQRSFTNKFDVLKSLANAIEADPQQLLVSSFLKNFWPISVVSKELEALRVFQLNPRLARQPAAPSVHGDLGRRGENLASALDRMRLHDDRNFKKLSSWLKDVVPNVSRVLTDYTETRQLGLFFEEEGFGARWFAEDVSDGTIMSVALFLTLLDSRHKNIVIEEPETSLHPWISQI